MKKVLMAGVLALVMAVGISAPGAAEEGITDTEIIVGSVQDLSGPLAAWGTQAKNGLEMRAREINEAGGIHGRKIKVVVEDSGYEPKKAVIVTNKMITRDKVFAFIGNLGSSTGLACLPVTTGKKVPALFPLSAAAGFTQPFNRYSFSVYPSYAEFCRGAVRYFIKEKGVKKVGCMYQDDELGHDHLRGVKEELAARNMELVAAESFKRGTTDFSSQIAKIRNAGAEVVILGTVIRETVGALKEAKKIGWDVYMCGGSPAAVSKYIPLLSEQTGFSADGFYCASETPYVYADSEIPFVREWFQRHKEWFGTEPDMPTALAYIAMWLFEQGAKEVGRDLTREKLIETLETVKDLKNPFGTAPYSFSKTSHQGLDQFFMTQVKNGRYVKITDFISFQD